MASYRGDRMVCWWVLVCTVLSTASGHGVVLRNRRAAGDDGPCKEKFSRISGHSACLPRSSEVQTAGISDRDKRLILDTHNRYRGQASPAAANMLKMRWDDEIAKIAQRWAENCKYDHDEGSARTIPGRFSVGQNIGRGYKDWTAVIDGWHNEKDSFVFGGTGNAGTGHYTQMLWATSYRLGCGYADCSNARKYYVCNYGPAGNIGGTSRPYKSGSSQCGQKFKKDNLCDCGIDCLNGGTWNLSSCTCGCLKSFRFYVGNQCDLDCSKTNGSQPQYCGTTNFDAAGCVKYENVPYECPLTCDICPWGGVNYKPKEDPDGSATGLVPSLVVLTLAAVAVGMFTGHST